MESAIAEPVASTPVYEPEAAAFLGVTPRTLRNYRRKGELPYREVPGKTRPVIAYEHSDLARFKERLEQKPQQQQREHPQRRQALPPVQASARAPRVTFGMAPAEYEKLLLEAQDFGMTAGEYARRLVREGQESRFQEEAAELRALLEKANVEIRNLRSEVASAFEVVLEYIGQTPEEARDWVSDNLR